MIIIDSEYTDEDGVAELTTPTLNSVGTQSFIVTHGNVEYPTSVQVVDVDTINLTPSDNYAYSDGDVVLTAVALDSNNSPISNLKINVNGTVTVTDSDGKATGVYTGTGTAGTVNVSASCGSESTTIQIEDVMQYWSQSENKKYNLNYKTRGQILVQELMKGIKLSTDEIEEGRVWFTNPYRLSESWEFSFVVKSYLQNGTHFYVSLANISSYLQANCIVKVTYNKSTGVRTVYVNDTVVSTNSNRDVIDTDLKLTGEVLIDNIKLKRL